MEKEKPCLESGDVTACSECGEPTAWLRYTQFVGTHPFCDTHARAELNFGRNDPSYWFWNEIDENGQEVRRFQETITSKHPTELKSGDILAAANEVENLRYDRVSVFVGQLANAFEDRSKKDQQSERPLLAILLANVASDLRSARDEIDRAWKICKPHMEETPSG